jgi:hypothetical protein
VSTCIAELAACVFCGGTEMSEEHLIAHWVHRAFARKRKPTDSFRATIKGTAMRLEDGDADVTAKVICRSCNNGWVARIDNAAAGVARPLIRGLEQVALDRAGQTAFAAWIYKTALMFDAAEHGPDGQLASLRAGLMESGLAGPGCVIYAGPACRPPSLTVGDGGEATEVNLWMLGIQPTNRKLRLTGTVTSADGRESITNTTEHVISGYRIMIGALWAYLGGAVVPPVDAETLEDFSRIWPAQDDHVMLRTASLNTRDTA